MITGYITDSIAFFFSSVTRLTFAMCLEKISSPFVAPKKRYRDTRLQYLVP
jgi:hypothetical protein